MKTLNMGEYLDRTVTLQSVNEYDRIDISAINRAVTLIWIGENGWDNNKFPELIGKILKTEPIGLGVSGHHVSEQFDLLIKTQSYTIPKEHTMTYIFRDNNIEEVLEYFFCSAVPGDRWDEWEKYHIIIINDKENSKLLRRLLPEKFTAEPKSEQNS